MTGPWSLFTAALCAVGISLAAPAQSGVSVTSREESGVTQLFLDGVPFHLTRARVGDLRMVRVEDTGPLLVLWEESRQEPTGPASIPHYAISLGGEQMDSVRAADFRLQLRRASFDPLEDVPDLSSSPLPSGGGVQIVQFVTQPLETFDARIAELGGEVLAYLPYHAKLVRMSAATRAQLLTRPWVRWIGPYHPEYRVEPAVLASLARGDLAPGRYFVRTFRSGPEEKLAVAAAIRALGGRVEQLVPDGFLLEATLTAGQLAAVAALDEVQFIDPAGEPGVDMDIARAFSGASYLEGLTGFTGQGVRGEVMDTGVLTSHVDFTGNGGVLLHGTNATNWSHGTSTTGIVFGAGASAPGARGVLPGLAGGGRIVSSSFVNVSNRKAHTLELTDPTLQWQCVFQSNSWGYPQVVDYTNVSAAMDDIVFDADILIFQSQSNNGNQSSRPEAWSKNVVSVGGILHNNTLSDADDTHSGASFGPAADGRVKPDLAHFYDGVLTTSSTSTSATTAVFNGTSAATPITAGHAAHFFELWHDNAFGNNPAGATVFASRPHFETAKAAILNTAAQWRTSGAVFLDRMRQGWGRVDLRALYDLRAKTFFADRQRIANLQTLTYALQVSAGTPAFKATLVYRDLPGLTGATLHRVNDLDLRVVPPSGATYWGNQGLQAGRWSSSGGAANDRDTVEHVFVQAPQAGTWKVQVIGADINTDLPPYAGIAGNQADFSLWVTGVDDTCAGSGSVYCSAQANSSGCLPQISSTGSARASSPSGFQIRADRLIPSQPGILFYGLNGPASTPLHNGTLCVAPPTKRARLDNTGGAGACSGALSIDFNTWVFLGNDLALVPGASVHAQYWSRDPGAPFGDNLSDALRFTICP